MVKNSVILVSAFLISTGGCALKSNRDGKTPLFGDPSLPLYCPVVETTTTIAFSHQKGLCLYSSRYIEVFTNAPYQAEFRNEGFLHHPAWMHSSKIWGISIHDLNRAITQVDEWPPNEVKNDWYLDVYGKTSAEIFLYWRISGAPKQDDNRLEITLTDPCAIGEFEITRTREDTCRQTNPNGIEIGCGHYEFNWAGPGDIDLNGAIDDNDFFHFQANPYDFNGDEVSDEIDQYQIETLIFEAQNLGCSG